MVGAYTDGEGQKGKAQHEADGGQHREYIHLSTAEDEVCD